MLLMDSERDARSKLRVGDVVRVVGGVFVSVWGSS